MATSSGFGTKRVSSRTSTRTSSKSESAQLTSLREENAALRARNAELEAFIEEQDEVLHVAADLVEQMFPTVGETH